jgi:hypothetical protein
MQLTFPSSDGYREKCRWWEAIVLVRKFFLQLIVVFIGDPVIQGTSCSRLFQPGTHLGFWFVC